MDEHLVKALQQLFADLLTQQAFQAQIAFEIARLSPEPETWVLNFTAALHGRIAANEERVGPDAQKGPVHTLANANVDRLRHALALLLKAHPS